MAAKSKSDIAQFDNLSISDLMGSEDKELMVAIFLKIKQLNGKVNWHDWAIKGIISTFSLGIVAAVIIGIINFCF